MSADAARTGSRGEAAESDLELSSAVTMRGAAAGMGAGAAAPDANTVERGPNAAAYGASTVDSGPTIHAEALEIVLPGGDGVGPWTARVEAGESLLVVAPSGAGKSTLLRALAGAIPQHIRGRVTGTVRVTAADGSGIDPVAEGVAATARAVAMLGQDPATGVCLPTVADDLALPLESRAVDPVLIGPAIARALRAVGAEHLLDREAATLSGGELQRVALAGALIGQPSVLLLDEPTAMLDGDGIAAVRAALAAVPSRVTTILVEHRLDEWGSGDLPGRTLVLDRSGRVLADGRTAHVLAEHGAALVAEGCWVPAAVELAAVAPELLAIGAGGGPVDASGVNGGHETDAAGPNPSAVAGLEPAGIVAAAPAQTRPPPTAGREPSAPPLLRARDLALTRGGCDVLTGVDLDLRAGEVLAIIGRNGAGKSTLLAALAGLEIPRAGTVTGERAGLVPQNPEHLFIGRTVRDEVAIGDRDAADGALARVRLDDLAARSTFTLSGGQKRRLAIAAMLAHSRRVLLADEPTIGLDRAATAQVIALLRAVAAGGGTVAMTSHDLRAVAACADRAAVLAEGRLQTVVPLEELVRDPALLDLAGMSIPPLVARAIASGLPLRATLEDLGRRGEKT